MGSSAGDLNGIQGSTPVKHIRRILIQIRKGNRLQRRIRLPCPVHSVCVFTCIAAADTSAFVFRNGCAVEQSLRYCLDSLRYYRVQGRIDDSPLICGNGSVLVGQPLIILRKGIHNRILQLRGNIRIICRRILRQPCPGRIAYQGSDTVSGRLRRGVYIPDLQVLRPAAVISNISGRLLTGTDLSGLAHGVVKGADTCPHRTRKGQNRCLGQKIPRSIVTACRVIRCQLGCKSSLLNRFNISGLRKNHMLQIMTALERIGIDSAYRSRDCDLLQRTVSRKTAFIQGRNTVGPYLLRNYGILHISFHNQEIVQITLIVLPRSNLVTHLRLDPAAGRFLNDHQLIQILIRILERNSVIRCKTMGLGAVGCLKIKLFRHILLEILCRIVVGSMRCEGCLVVHHTNILQAGTVFKVIQMYRCIHGLREFHPLQTGAVLKHGTTQLIQSGNRLNHLTRSLILYRRLGLARQVYGTQIRTAVKGMVIYFCNTHRQCKASQAGLRKGSV